MTPCIFAATCALILNLGLTNAANAAARLRTWPGPHDIQEVFLC